MSCVDDWFDVHICKKEHAVFDMSIYVKRNMQSAVWMTSLIPFLLLLLQIKRVKDADEVPMVCKYQFTELFCFRSASCVSTSSTQAFLKQYAVCIREMIACVCLLLLFVLLNAF